MYKVKLENLSNDHCNLRTAIAEGEAERLPTVGQSFAMTGEGLDFGTRLITTSPVTEVTKIGDNEVNFKTLNSLYKVTVQ